MAKKNATDSEYLPYLFEVLLKTGYDNFKMPSEGNDADISDDDAFNNRLMYCDKRKKIMEEEPQKTACYVCINDIHKSADPTSYHNDCHNGYYICKYTNHYAARMWHLAKHCALFTEAQPNTEAQPKDLRILSFGCGAGMDLAGFEYALRIDGERRKRRDGSTEALNSFIVDSEFNNKEGRESKGCPDKNSWYAANLLPPKSIIYKGVDISDDWDSYHCALKDNIDKMKKKYPHPYVVSADFQTADVLKYLKTSIECDNSDSADNVARSNVFVMQYFLDNLEKYDKLDCFFSLLADSLKKNKKGNKEEDCRFCILIDDFQPKGSSNLTDKIDSFINNLAETFEVCKSSREKVSLEGFTNSTGKKGHLVCAEMDVLRTSPRVKDSLEMLGKEFTLRLEGGQQYAERYDKAWSKKHSEDKWYFAERRNVKEENNVDFQYCIEITGRKDL